MNEDNTSYLDEFLQSSINNSKYKNKTKARKLNIPTICFLSSIILSFSLVVIAKIIQGHIGEIIAYIAIALLFLTIIITPIINTVLHNKLTIFIENPDYYRYVANTKKIDDYLRCVNKTSFKEHNSYCITEPTLSINDEYKTSYGDITYSDEYKTSYGDMTYSDEYKTSDADKTDSDEYETSDIGMIICFLMPLIIGSICTYIKYGANWSVIMWLDVILIFFSVGFDIVYAYCIKYFIRKSSNYYDESVDAVCVEVDSQTTRDSDNKRYTSYGAILYTKCKNGHKYILMPSVYSNHIPYIGEIYQLKVKSSNPISYDYKKFNKSSYLPYTIFGLCFMAFSLFSYIFCLFNNTLV